MIWFRDEEDDAVGDEYRSIDNSHTGHVKHDPSCSVSTHQRPCQACTLKSDETFDETFR